MRSPRSITAALVLGAATILTVAACGASVQGTPVADTSAMESQIQDAVPTDLSDLSSLLENLPTELPSLPDLSLPSLPELPTNISIPGVSTDCLAVAQNFGLIAVAIGSVALSSGNFDASGLLSQLDSLSGSVPDELKPDVQTLIVLAEDANGKPTAQVLQIFSTPEYSDALNNISTWVDANCGGN